MTYSDQELKEIKNHLQTALLGREIIAQDQVASTNDLAKKALRDGAREGTVYLADAQTGGRGRQGRSWHSEPGNGLYCSLILTPALPPENVAALTLVAGVAAVQALTAFSPKSLSLKWPNDVLIENKKVAGILSEYVADGNRPGAVVGIGINVSQAQFPSPLDQIATSLHITKGSSPDRGEVLAAFLNQLEVEYQIFLSEGLSPILEKWSEHSQMWERPIVLQLGDQKFSGTAQRLDERGGLVVRLDSGEERAFDSGEVTLGSQPKTP